MQTAAAPVILETGILALQRSSLMTMLSNVSRTAARRSSRLVNVCVSCRTIVTPSSADRASIVDLPSSFQDDGHFSPRSGTVIMSLTQNRLPEATNCFFVSIRYVWIQD